MNKEELIKSELYKKSTKELVVGLKEFHRYWYDLIVFPNAVADYFDSRELIRKKLATLKKEISEHFDKHFVYFIVSRKLVRFDIENEAIINTNDIRVKLLIGKDRQEKIINFSLDFAVYKIDLLDKYITIWKNENLKYTYTIHEFLDHFNINLGIYNKVEYVGYTKNPDTRPTNGSHSGLNDVLYKVPNNDNDFLIIFNIFETLVKAYNEKIDYRFLVMNPLEAKLEGELIEKCLISYFNSDNQNRNRTKEEKEIINTINNEGFNSVTINYEYELVNDYSYFFSNSRRVNKRHFFTIKANSDSLELFENIANIN